MTKKEFEKELKKAIKPLICICGKKYSGDYKGGFVSNGNINIWCCCKKCADEIIKKLR